MVLYLWYGCQMLRPLDEILNFLYLNEIGTKIEHLNLATLSDNQSQKVYEIDSTKKLHVFYHAKNLIFPKRHTTSKRKQKNIHLNIKTNKECSKNYVYFIVESNNHDTKMNIIFPTSHIAILQEEEKQWFSPKIKENPILKKRFIVNPIYKSSSKDILIN